MAPRGLCAAMFAMTLPATAAAFRHHASCGTVAASAAPCGRSARGTAMASWQQEDLNAPSMALPEEIELLLSADTDRVGTRKLWCAMRRCYATEADAIAAVRRNTGTILPYLNRPVNIKGSFAYLVDSLGVDGARDVITKNPGVLTIDPKAIVQSSPEDIVRAANFIDKIDSAPIPLVVRNNADKLIFLIGAALVYKRIAIDCAGASCGSGG